MYRSFRVILQLAHLRVFQSYLSVNTMILKYKMSCWPRLPQGSVTRWSSSNYANFSFPCLPWGRIDVIRHPASIPLHLTENESWVWKTPQSLIAHCVAKTFQGTEWVVAAWVRRCLWWHDGLDGARHNNQFCRQSLYCWERHFNHLCRDLRNTEHKPQQ